jgi:hypothetical protein
MHVKKPMSFPLSTKIHEAGHALGLVLTVGDFGYDGDVSPIKKITFEIKHGMIIAATHGLTVSAMMLQRFTANEIKMLTSLPPEAVRRACAGLDMSKWMRAKLLVSAMGPAAEARFSNMVLTDVLNAQRCQHDRQDMVTTCMIGGVQEKDEIDKEIGFACVHAGQIVRQDAAWEAISRLAAALPDSGSFSGNKAVEILAMGSLVASQVCGEQAA